MPVPSQAIILALTIAIVAIGVHLTKEPTELVSRESVLNGAHIVLRADTSSVLLRLIEDPTRWTEPFLEPSAAGLRYQLNALPLSPPLALSQHVKMAPALQRGLTSGDMLWFCSDGAWNSEDYIRFGGVSDEGRTHAETRLQFETMGACDPDPSGER